jgi:hypothetical protein
MSMTMVSKRGTREATAVSTKSAFQRPSTEEPMVQKSGMQVPVSVRTQADETGLVYVDPLDATALGTLVRSMTAPVTVLQFNANTIEYDVSFVGSPGAPTVPDASWLDEALDRGRVVLVQVDSIGSYQMAFLVTTDGETVAQLADEPNGFAVIWIGGDQGALTMMDAEAYRTDPAWLAAHERGTAADVPTKEKEVPEVRLAAAETGLPSWVLPAAVVGSVGVGLLWYLRSTGRV